jgi:NRE family putative nickel resistance protein-like MFS transporter
VFTVFGALRNRRFARLYAAQAVSQVGDALTWVALALLAYELGKSDAVVVLGVALTVRVGAFVVLSPWAGVLADRMERKIILVSAHFGRAAIIGLMPLVTDVWQVYVLVLAYNALTAFFTPVNQATVPLVVGRDSAADAFALSSATTEVLSIMGPGLAGVLAMWLGGRALFYVDALTLVAAGLLVSTLPSLRVPEGVRAETGGWRDVLDGTSRLWRDPPVRFALSMELVAAIAGALVLVVTVLRVKSGLGLGDLEYGWVMALYGLGAAAGSLAFSSLGTRVPRTLFVLLGAALTSVAILPADEATLAPLMALWLLAGVGQNWVNLPTETLLAERTPEGAQGRVYGAHFAWSHLWWAMSYPFASLLSSAVPDRTFLFGGLAALLALVIMTLALRNGVDLRVRTPAGEPGPGSGP